MFYHKFDLRSISGLVYIILLCRCFVIMHVYKDWQQIKAIYGSRKERSINSIDRSSLYSLRGYKQSHQIPGMYVSVLLSQHTSLAILNQSSAAPFRGTVGA